MEEATHVLSTIGPLEGLLQSDPVLTWHARDLLARPRQWVGYLSSTSVYGGRQGGWVSEEDEPRPDTPKGLSRLAAEQEWRALGETKAVHIFRLAGIYGPGRSALDTLLRHGGDLAAACGVSSTSAQEGPVISRIHVEDICRIVGRSMERWEEEDAPHPLFNIADDLPAPRLEVFRYAASLLGQAPPDKASRQAAADNTDLSPPPSSSLPRPGGRSRGGSKRVANTLVKTHLLAGEGLVYPTYREGLLHCQASLAESTGWMRGT